MIPQEGLNIKYLWAAFQRRFWMVVFPFFIFSLTALVYAIIAPKIFVSSALILIQPQEVPTEYVRSTVTTDVQARLNSITEQVMSRSRLEEIINKYDLYPKIRATRTMYSAVEKLRENITLNIKEVGSNRRWQDAPAAFEVSYEGQDPKLVRDVTADISNLYIDYNFRLRAEQAAGTTKFLARELKRMKEKLRKKEEMVRQFKEEYIGFLPEQMQNNYSILTRLQQHSDSINESLQKTEDRRILLQAQMNKLDALQTETRHPGDEESRPLSLDELRQELSRLKARYSDKHPDVVRITATIAKMENDQETAVVETDSEVSRKQTPADRTERLMLFQKEDTLTELKIIDAEVRALRHEKERTAEQIRTYQQRIEQGPKIEAMFVDLRRDYERASENYQSLLQKKMEAELSENLERTQKGEQFKIIDAANLSEKPTKPNIPKILAMGLMLALGSGFGLAFLREYLDPTFWSRKEIENKLELPVLVSIPIIVTDREKRWKKIKLAVSVCVLLAMSSTLLFALFILLKKNPTLLPIPI